MVTLEAAGGPPQSPQLPLTPHIPEQSWKEPPPPFLQLIFAQNRSFSENTGPSTLTYGTTYSPPADTNDAANVTTMADTTPKPLSSAPSAFVHPPFHLNLAETIGGCNLLFNTTDPTKRPTDSQAPHGFQGTTNTHDTQTSTTTKTTEKETKDSLYINHHGHTTTLTPQQHPSSTIRNQEDAPCTNTKPRRPLFVRVIRKSNTNALPLHTPTQSAPTPITHSTPTIVPNAGHGSDADSSRPRRIVRIRRNLPLVQPRMHPGSCTPRADHLLTPTSSSSTTISTPSGNLKCPTDGPSHGRRRIVLVRRKGEPTYHPTIRQQPQHPTLTDRHPPNSVPPSTVLPLDMSPTPTTLNGPHQDVLITPTIESHSSSSTISDTLSPIPSDMTVSNNLGATSAFPALNIAHCTTDFIRLTSGLLISTEISSRKLTYRSFLRLHSVSVVPESLWHHRIRSYHHHLQNPSAALRNQNRNTGPFYSTTLQPVITQYSTFDAAHVHNDYGYHRSLHADDYTAILTGIPWYKPVSQQHYPASHHVSVRPGQIRLSIAPTSRYDARTKQYWTHYRHTPALDLYRALYRFEHRRLRSLPPYKVLPTTLHSVSLPTSLTDDKNLLRPP